MKKTKKLHRAFNWAFLLLSLTLLFRLGGAWHNSLALGHKWISEKVSREDLPGAIEFMTSPSTLRGETLRLGSWLGHQRIHSKDFINSPSSGELRFDLRLGRDSYLLFSFLNEQGDQPVAIRLSRTIRHPSAIFRISGEEFLEKRALSEVKLGSSFSTIYLRWTPEKSELQIDREKYPICITIPKKFQLGFSGGADSADAIKNIRLHEIGKRSSLFREYFLPQYGKSLAALLFCIFILLVVITNFLSEKNRFLVNLVVLIVLFLGVVFNERVLLPRAASLAQAQEVKPLEILAKMDGPTILLSSASDGRQLALAMEASLRKQTKKLWNIATRLPEGASPDYLLIGVDVQGGTSCAELLAAAKLNYPKSKRLFIEIPQETSFDSEALKQEEACMLLATQEKIPFLSARKSLEDKMDAGFIWWDRWHLTRLGLELFLASVTPGLASYVAH